MHTSDAVYLNDRVHTLRPAYLASQGYRSVIITVLEAGLVWTPSSHLTNEECARIDPSRLLSILSSLVY